MTITVNLPPAIIEEFKAEAAATGKDVEKLVREAPRATIRPRSYSGRHQVPNHDFLVLS